MDKRNKQTKRKLRKTKQNNETKTNKQEEEERNKHSQTTTFEQVLKGWRKIHNSRDEKYKKNKNKRSKKKKKKKKRNTGATKLVVDDENTNKVEKNKTMVWEIFFLFSPLKRGRREGWRDEDNKQFYSEFIPVYNNNKYKIEM